MPRRPGVLVPPEVTTPARRCPPARPGSLQKLSSRGSHPLPADAQGNPRGAVCTGQSAGALDWLGRHTALSSCPRKGMPALPRLSGKDRRRSLSFLAIQSPAP